MREELSKILVLNYQTLQQSFEMPMEFAFLKKEEIKDLQNSTNKNEIALNFFGIPLNREEQERIIIRSLNKKAEEHKKIDCWETLLQNFGFKLNESWYFEGDSESWFQFMEKIIFPRKKAIILNPKISLKLESFSFPIELQPTAIIYYCKKFTLLLQTHSKNTNKSFFGIFIFYEFFFKNYLNLNFSEFSFFYSPEEVKIDYYFSIPTIKSLNNSITNISYFPIYKVFSLSKPKFEESIFSEFLTQSEYDHLFYIESENNKKNDFSKLFSQLDKFRAQIIDRLFQLNNLAVLIEKQLPEQFELSTWYKNISWIQFLNIQSLKSNYFKTKEIGIFTAESKIFKAAISVLFPNFPILWSSLFDLPKIFSIIDKNNNYLINNSKPISYKYFLNYIFWKSELDEKKNILESSIFSREGKKLFIEKILNIKWKIYYDFESWEDMLTQLSFQIFRGEELFLKGDLIRNPFDSSESFQKECILKLSIPIINELEKFQQQLDDERNKYIELFKNTIVYISFNKTFECTWLNKLSKLFSLLGDNKNSLLSNLIKELTVDLSDWFKFSAYTSLNIIGELLGAHTLKKLAGIVQTKESKKYSQLQWAQDGRSASLIYLYFYSEIFNIGNIKNLQNEKLSPINWIRGHKEKNLKSWEFISFFLKEYCYYDVQNMVDGVSWLKENYLKNEKYLVSRSEILKKIHQFKKLNSQKTGELISSYIDRQSSSMEFQ